MDAVVWLEEVGKNDLSVVGGKGASLGEMINIGVPVPGGFAVTAQAFRDFINRAGIAKKLFEALEVDVNQESELHRAEEMAKKLIMDARVPDDIEKAIKSRYEELCKREGEQVFVAVRASAGHLFTGRGQYFTGWSRALNMIRSTSPPLCRRWWTLRSRE